MTDEPVKFPWGSAPPSTRVIDHSRLRLPLIGGGLLLLAVFLLSNAVYSVQPTELAFTRTFGLRSVAR